MISISKISSSVIEKGYRILKVLEFGPKTADECAPFGDDSNPLKGMSAVFAETSVEGEPVIIGYLNENQLAAAGEKRIYSLKEDGSVSSFIWLNNDGKIQLNGNTDNAVRYAKLEEAINLMDTSINAELTKIVTAISTLGGSYTMEPIQTDISAAKIDDLKTS